MASGYMDMLMAFIENEKRLGKVANVEEYLCQLLDANKTDETKLRHVLCSIEDLLNNHNKWQVNLGKKTFTKLITLLNKDEGIPTNLAVYILICIKEYVDKLPMEPSQDLVEELWCLAKNFENEPHAPVILVQLFDLFVQHIDNFLYETQLSEVIHQLLSSPDKIQRKTAMDLMNLQTTAIEKSDDVEVEISLRARGWEDKQTYVDCLCTYMKIWDDLDGEVIPSIRNMEHVVTIMRSASEEWQKIWIELLYERLLSPDNIDITRGTVEHIMNFYNFSDLSLRLRKHFCLITNNVLLYDVNDGILSRLHMHSFLNTSRLEFMEAFITIDNWNFVPTHFWFSYFQNEDCHPTISYDLLMRIAKCVRRQSYEIRGIMQTFFLFNIFQTTIKCLTIPKYIAFSEALYDIDDGFHHTFQFIELVDRNRDTDLSPFTKRFYDIFTSRLNNYEYDSYAGCTSPIFNNLLKDICNRLKLVPNEKHGWLRFVLVFNLKQTSFVIEFCHDRYDLDLTSLQLDRVSLPEFHKRIADKLLWNPEEEADFLYSKCVDLYTQFQLHYWSDMKRLSLDPIKLIAMGNLHTYTRLLRLLGEHREVVSQHILDSLLQILKEKYLGRKIICQLFMRNMHRYAEYRMTELEWGNLLLNVLNLDLDHRVLTYQATWHLKMSKEFLIRGLLHGEPSNTAKSIQEAYEEMMLKTIPNNMALRHCFKSKKQLHLNTLILDDLLRINNELSIRIPEYHEHSKVHRLKMRIAQAIFSIHDLYKWQYWSEELWTALLEDFNLRNIRYLYELMVVKFALSVEQILVKIRQISEFSGANKLSLLSVVYNYYMINRKTVRDEQLLEITDLISPLTMSNNCLVRQYAQVMIYVLVKEIDSKRINKPNAYDDFQRNARIALGDERLVELLLQPRFKMHEYYKQSSSYANDMLLYVTNAPIDECVYWVMRTSFDTKFQQQFNECRETYIKDMKTKPKTFIAAANNVNLNFGPYTFYPKRINEILYNTALIEKSEMIVVASLIDYLCNLIGIVSTCDLLGINKIIISSRRLLQNTEFKFLRLKSILNISEVRPEDLMGYLNMKRNEGYKIVGAEQTANCVSFNCFQFPAKCILLLGHELQAIPSHLINVLDYVVGIPQLGDVRSLNVQITGALFMLEYCRQHTPLTKVEPELIRNFSNRNLNWQFVNIPKKKYDHNYQ